MTSVAPLEIVSAHSPDSDDAFMFYGLATKKVRRGDGAALADDARANLVEFAGGHAGAHLLLHRRQHAAGHNKLRW